MKRYFGISITSNRVLENWDGYSEFTNNAIDEFAKNSIGKDIFFQFNCEERIGKIVKSINNNGKLEIEFIVPNDKLSVKGFRCVPCYIVNKDEWIEEDNSLIRIIQSARIIYFGLCNNPVEKDLPEIKEI